MKLISGSSFDFTMGETEINSQKVTLKITGGKNTVYTGGKPVGFTTGQNSAEGELEVTIDQFKLIIEEADKAGSFEQLPPVDLVFFASTPDVEIKYEAFGCVFDVDSLLDADSNSNDASTVSLKYMVTSPDFIRINGVPYLKQDEE